MGGGWVFRVVSSVAPQPPHKVSPHTLGLYSAPILCVASPLPMRTPLYHKLQCLLSSRPEQQEADYQVQRQKLSTVLCKARDHKGMLEEGNPGNSSRASS